MTIAAGPSHAEGNSGTTPFIFTINLSHGYSLPVTVSYRTSDGTATVADNDYVAVAGQTVTFDDGDTADKTVDVTVNDDSIYEAAETVNLSLSGTTINRPLQNGPDFVASGSSATLTITNDDAPPTLSINDVTQNEGNAGTTDFTFTVTKTGATEVNATVSFATQNGSATAPGDYQSNSGTLTFLPGDATKTFIVLVNGDTTEEPDEDFTVHLSAPTDATISDADGTGTIKNDDNAPTFSVGDVTHAEGNSGTTDFTFTVTKTGATAFSTSVDVATADGTDVTLSLTTDMRLRRRPDDDAQLRPGGHDEDRHRPRQRRHDAGGGRDLRRRAQQPARRDRRRRYGRGHDPE